MSDPKLAELIAMSGRATQGRWLMGWWLCRGANAKFIAALVNWFRETYTKERA